MNNVSLLLFPLFLIIMESLSSKTSFCLISTTISSRAIFFNSWSEVQISSKVPFSGSKAAFKMTISSSDGSDFVKRVDASMKIFVNVWRS